MGKQKSSDEFGYKTYQDVLNYWSKIEPLIPKGVAQRIEARLNFKFTEPWVNGKPRTKSSGCDWSIAGINEFYDKCCKLRVKLNEAKRDGIDASEFDLWLDENILPRKVSGIDDRLTYAQIFEIIENEYYEGKHKFQREKRNRDIPSYQRSFKICYTNFFSRCPDPTAYPDKDNIKTFWNNFPDDTKKHEALGKLKKIASYCPEATKKPIMSFLNKQKAEKKQPTNKKAIDWDQFFKWLNDQDKLIKEMPESQAEVREGWLWIFKMCATYGLRPAEFMSAVNLTKPLHDQEVKKLWGEKGLTYGDSNNVNPAFNDRVNNPKMLLILGNGFTVTNEVGQDFWITNKTGGRFLYPLIKSREILDFLNLQNIPVKLPEYTPEQDTHPETIAISVSKRLGDKLRDWNCPTSQGYSFRNLGKMMGKLSGIPSSVIADIMGHSELASEQSYNRQTIGLAAQLVENSTNYPLPYDVAIGELKAQGINVNDNDIQTVLKIVYQLE